LHQLKTTVPYSNMTNMCTTYLIYCLPCIFYKHFLKNSFLYEFYILPPLLYMSVNNTFLLLFTNNFLIYSYDALCKAKDLFPNCSRKFLKQKA
jgi:hypothetical protein